METRNTRKGRKMNPTLWILTFLMVTGLTLGCTPTDDKSAVKPRDPESAAVHLDEAKEKTKEAAQAVQDYTYAQKAEFVDRMKQQLLDMQDEMDRLSAKVEKTRGDVKADAKIRLEAARAKWDLAKKQLDKAVDATETTWDDVKGAFQDAYHGLEESFEKTRDWLSAKIDP